MYNCSQNNGRKGIRADAVETSVDFSALRDQLRCLSMRCQHGFFSFV